MPNVTIARDGAIATVTLNRPARRNSLSDEMLTDLAAAFAALRDDADSRVVIVTGAPPVWGLTLAADFRLAAAEAELWIPEVDLGVPLGVASTTRFVRLVGPARAKEIILECRRYTAEEARAMGLVHRVVPGAALLAEARGLAERLAAKPFRPLAEMKARINAIARTGIPDVNAMTEGFLGRE
ncbi:MAG: enoyl-CoA hydratase/isomerase family protein [Candidatus Rokubacteria bacterium]|nr:enoyl-CoA hydratase/isomerase family protein [Candidatus Rokubacteria bacterium]